MSLRIKNFDRSVRREAARAQEALRTIEADSTAPRDTRARVEHYRRHLADANRVIDTLQVRIAEMEAKAAKTKEDTDYLLSLCVTRTTAQRDRLAAFNLARNKATAMAEPDDVPSMLSEAIYAIKPPQKWSRN
ncbi:MAG: hypothetical protein ACT6U0_07760 [Shinella sp.]|uniref:hypothetical protein n=1 Tax=Shinella sp. TaxID=1870904 RepID=UPI0040371190